MGELGAGAGWLRARHPELGQPQDLGLRREKGPGPFCGKCGLEELRFGGLSSGPSLARSLVGGGGRVRAQEDVLWKRPASLGLACCRHTTRVWASGGLGTSSGAGGG